MDKDNIQEGNRIIGEFMGKNFKDPLNYMYDNSWNELMPAVKKWNDLAISKRTGDKPGWTKWQYKTVMLRTEIEPVFKDLVEAIKWFNNQNK